MSALEPVLEARGLVKRFGGVTALNGADFSLNAGEILAVIGDNGAGKSTLIKALSGALQPDEGEILLDGESVHFRSPLDARARESRPSTRTLPSPRRSTSPRTSSSGGSCSATAHPAACSACWTSARCAGRPVCSWRS